MATPTYQLDPSVGASLNMVNGPVKTDTTTPANTSSTQLTPAQQANNNSIASGGFKPTDVVGSTTPTPISSDTLGKGGTPLPTTPSSNNAGTANTALGVTANGTTTTQPTTTTTPTTDTTKPDLSSKGGVLDYLKNLIGIESTKGDFTTKAQTDADVAGKTQALNDLNAQALKTKMAYQQQIDSLKSTFQGTSQGLSEQVTKIQQQANQDLANIGIQQQVAQGNLTAAQDIVKQKVDAQFGHIDDNIKYLTDLSNIENNDLSDSEKIKLQSKIDQLKTDSADVKSFANTIMSNMIQNKAPQSAYSSVDKILSDYADGKISADDAKSQIAQATGSYAGDAYKSAQTAKLNADAIKEATDSANSSVSILDGNSNPISVPTSVAPYVGTSSNGVNYVDASTLQGTAAEKKKIVDEAQAAGLKVILNKNSILDLTNIKDANSKLNTVTSLLNNIDQPDALARDLGGYGLTQLGVLAQTNPQAAIAQSIPIIGLDVLKAISGVQGFRGNQTAIQQVQDHLPKPTDTADVVKGKIEFIRKLLNDRENAITGTPPLSKGTQGVINGKTYTYNGTGDTTDINNWTLQQ